MVVTLGGMRTPVSFWHWEKAYQAMFRTPWGISHRPDRPGVQNSTVLPSAERTRPFSALKRGVPAAISMRARLSLAEKASLSMVVTLAGMVMEVRPRHSKKARSPISVTPSGMVMWDRL